MDDLLLIYIDINIDINTRFFRCVQTTAAQDEGEMSRTAGQGAEHFMAKWIAAEKARAGLRYTVVCPNVTGRTKERIV